MQKAISQSFNDKNYLLSLEEFYKQYQEFKTELME